MWVFQLLWEDSEETRLAFVWQPRVELPAALQQVTPVAPRVSREPDRPVTSSRPPPQGLGAARALDMHSSSSRGHEAYRGVLRGGGMWDPSLACVSEACALLWCEHLR